MNYTVITGNNSFPSDRSYQLIDLVANIVLDWPTSFPTGFATAYYNEINPDQDAWTITLPDATLASNGVDVIFSNISIYTFDILDNDSQFLLTINPGEIIDFKLYDNTTSAGGWRNIPFGGGVAGVIAFEAASSDDSIVIDNGNVTAPGGTIDFKLPTSLSNLNLVDSKGIVVTTATSPLEWQTVEILGSGNILVSNGDGVAGNPTMELNTEIIGLTSLEIGDLTITGNQIAPTSTDVDLVLKTTGVGVLNLNGSLIDVNGTAAFKNLVVIGQLSNPLIPKAIVTFTDTIVGPSNSIVIKDQSNVASVTGSNGSYEISFTRAMNSINYGITFGLSTDGGTLPQISRAFYTTTNLSSFSISVVDDSNEPVLSIPLGITVVVHSST